MFIIELTYPTFDITALGKNISVTLGIKFQLELWFTPEP